MQRLTLFLLSAVLAVALAEGQYYVPRAYYTIDEAGHASPPVPLQRLRRSSFYPGARAIADDNTARARAGVNSRRGLGTPSGSWGIPGEYGDSRPLRSY